jgi:hypothetical protein
MDDRDTDRLKVLDRIADRVPELDLDQEQVEWTTLHDGHEALLVNGGGMVNDSAAPALSSASTPRSYPDLRSAPSRR